MYEEKYMSHRSSAMRKRKISLIVALLLVLAVGIGTALAYVTGENGVAAEGNMNCLSQLKRTVWNGSGVFRFNGYNNLSSNPWTGDYIIMAAGALMVVSGVALLILLIIKCRKDHK